MLSSLVGTCIVQVFRVDKYVGIGIAILLNADFCGMFILPSPTSCLLILPLHREMHDHSSVLKQVLLQQRKDGLEGVIRLKG